MIVKKKSYFNPYERFKQPMKWGFKSSNHWKHVIFFLIETDMLLNFFTWPFLPALEVGDPQFGSTLLEAAFILLIVSYSFTRHLQQWKLNCSFRPSFYLCSLFYFLLELEFLCFSVDIGFLCFCWFCLNASSCSLLVPHTHLFLLPCSQLMELKILFLELKMGIKCWILVIIMRHIC